MSTFGEDLRMERVSRGIALEDITAVTKISAHHLLALEQNQFRQLPGGILNKGIVRGYATAVGLDQQDWTERFLKACAASGECAVDEDWTTFAANVGRARLQRREAAEFRLRWLGAGLLFLAAMACAYIVVRYYGVRAGWWSTLLPASHLFSRAHAVFLFVGSATKIRLTAPFS
ncbi:helix-turn-helix domain-containing protein [Acidobacteria bacterium AB60]|nr:helix-turn-helix domain-containing protein [Acidobacteria bacterium AB60]